MEADETYIGKSIFPKLPKGGFQHKNVVLTLVERGGKARSFHVERTDAVSILPVINENIAKEATVMTDDGRHYYRLRYMRKHEKVNHSVGEYVRGEVHTNTVEGYFSIFKRGMKGIYQHCGERHLHRYLAEFDFRYNHRVKLGINDEARAASAVAGVKGKRLTYRTTGRTRPSA